MLDDRERVIKAVQQLAPLPISARPAESDGMIFDLVPSDEQKVSVRCLDTGTDFDAPKPRRCRDERPCEGHGLLKGGTLAWTNV